MRDYLVLGDPAAATDVGVAVLTEVDARTTALRLVRDLTNPAAAPTVFSATGMLEGVQVSPDVRFTAWSDQGFNVRVVRHSDLASCDLNNTPRNDAFHPDFTASGGLVFWKETADTGAAGGIGWTGSWPIPTAVRASAASARPWTFWFPSAIGPWCSATSWTRSGPRSR